MGGTQEFAATNAAELPPLRGVVCLLLTGGYRGVDPGPTSPAKDLERDIPLEAEPRPGSDCAEYAWTITGGVCMGLGPEPAGPDAGVATTT